ncbi:MAG: PAS domain S-box protein [Desulfobaccales bacterium]
MRFKYSILYLFLSIMIIISGSTLFIGYYIYQDTLRQNMEDNEASKARDITYYINSTISDMINDIITISRLLKANPKLIYDLSQFEINGDLGPLKKTVDQLYANLPRNEVDLLVITDGRGHIVYRASAPAGDGDAYQAWGIEEAESGEEILAAGNGPRGWAIRSMTPLFKEGKQCGVLVLGIYLNDAFAWKIAEATHTQVSFSTPYKILASSWPPAARQNVGLPWVSRSIHEKRSFFHINTAANISSYHVPVDIGDETVCLIISTDTTPIFNLLQQKKRHLFLSFFGVLAVILGIGSGLTFTIVRPLRLLQQRAFGVIRDFSGEDLPVTRGGNEIETLSQAMEVMLATIQARLTDIEEAQETIQEREDFSARIFNGIQDGLVVMDRDFTILRANPSEEHHFRHDLPMVGRKCYELRHGRSQPCEECPCRQAMETGKTGYQLKTMMQGDWVEVFAFPLYDLASGQVTGVIEHIRDITKRKQAEEDLARKQVEFEAIFNSSSDGAVFTDTQRRVIMANPAFLAMFGWRLEEIIGQTTEFLYISKAEYEEMGKVRYHMGAQVEQTIFEKQYRRKDGSRVTCETLGTLVKDRQGQTIGFMGIHRDITQRKQTAEAVLKYEFIANAARDSMTLIDRNYVYEAANAAFCEAQGKTREEVVGHSVADIWGQDAFDSAIKGFLDQCFAGQAVAHEGWFVFGKRGRGCYEVFYNPYFDENGTVAYAAVVSHDLTGRKQMEEALRVSEERYRSLVENIDLGITLIGSDYRIKMLNNAFGKQFNKPVSEFIGKECFREFEKRNAACPHCPGRIAMATGKLAEVETEGVRDDGTTFVVNNHAFPSFGADGEITGFIEVVQDITERKQAEEALSKSHRELRETAQQLEQSMNMLQLIMESIPVRVFWKDRDLHYLGGNTLFARDAGFSRAEQLLGLDDFAMGWREQAEFYRADDRQVMASGLPKMNIIEPQTTPAGDMIWLNTSKVPLLMRNGEVFGVLGVYEDITARKQAEEALAEEAIRRRILVEQSRDGIVVLDQNGKVYEANQRYAEMLGYSAEEVRQLSIWDWDARWTREELLEQIRLCDMAGAHFETRHRRRDGTFIDVEISANGAVLAGQKLVFCVCRDISPRKAAEQALRESEENYRLLVRQIPALVFKGYADWSVDFFDEKIEAFAGYPKAEFDARGLTWKDLVLPEDQPEMKKRLLESLKKKNGAYVREYRIRRKSGEIAWIQERSQIFYQPPGRIGYISGVFFDITDRKHAEEALRQSEKRFKDIADNALQWVWEVDAQGKFTYSSPLVEQLLGYKPEEILNHYFYDFFHPDDREEMKNAAIEVFAAKAPFRDFVNRNLHQDGRSVWLSTSGTPILDDQGHILGYRGADTDITKRRQAEKALQENERFLASVFASIQDYITILDKDLNIVRVNPMREQAFLEDMPLVGKKCYEVIHHASRPCADCSALRTLETGEPAQRIVTVRLPQQENPRHFNLSTFPLINASGQVTGVVEVARDITEQKQAEEAVRERESMLSLVINTVPQVIFWKDLNSVYLGCNQNYARAAGLESPGAIVGKTEHDLPWQPRETEVYLAEDREVMQTREAKYHQVEVRQLADGRRIWVDGTKIPLLAGDDSVMGVLGVYEDVTVRKRMEEELRESETSYRTLAQNLPGLVYRVFVRENFRMEFYNEMLHSMTGYAPRELRPDGGSFGHLILSEDRAKVEDAVRQALARDQVFEVEYRFRHKNGSIRYFAERGKPIAGEDGKISHIDGVIWDITESKQLEAAIQESERRFRGLVENLPMGITIIQDGHLVYQNPEQGRLFGDLHIQSCRDMLLCVHPDDAAKAEQFCHGVADDLCQTDITLRFIPLNSANPEKRPVWVNCRASCINYRGQKAMLLNMMDITRTKELEFLMRVREKMASLGQVAAGIAHEIRNPLSGINVFLENIKENFQDPENAADVFELIEAAQATSNKIEGVIKRVLDFSRPTELKLALSDINLAVDDAIKLSATKLRKENVKIDCTLAADLPRVYADNQLLEQTMINMINNAAEALKGTGKAGRIHIATQAAHNAVLITIKDSGPGIPPAIRDKVFDPYFTTKSDGSGIGLSLCQRIITDHGGTIEVSTADLGGTQFVLRIPREKRGQA